MAVLKTLVSVYAEKELLGRIVKKDAMYIVTNHFIVSRSPKMYGLVLHNNDELLEFIRKQRAFVVNFLPSDFDEERMELIEAEKVFCKKVDGVESLECELIQEVAAGDSWIVIGKVLG